MTLRLNWGTGISAVYVLFACSTLGFVTFALSQPVDLVSADYYQRSLVQDGRMAAVENVRALGSSFHTLVDPHRRTVVVTLPAGHAASSGTVTLYRPSNAREDRQQALAPDSHGVQVIATDGLASGAWTLKVDWTNDGRAFYHETKVNLQ